MDNIPQNLKFIDYVRSLYCGKDPVRGIFNRHYSLEGIILKKLIPDEDLNYVHFYTTEIGFSMYGKQKHNRYN